MKNKSQLIRELVMEVLKDGESHSTEEIKKYILNKDANLLQVPNTLNSVLYYMIKSNIYVHRIDKGMYQYINLQEVVEENEEVEEMMEKPADNYYQFIDEIQNLCRRIDGSLRELTYALSEEEYSDNKRKYELKRKLEKIVNANN